MSATIYVRNSGDDDLTPDQLELLHRYSDQARVWAYLLLKEAGLIGSTEEWRQRREEWISLKNKLQSLNAAYADAVNKALQQQYREKKVSAETVLPSAKDFLPPESTPEQLSEATKLAETIKQHFVDLYPSRIEVGWSGPFLTPDEQGEMLRAPDPESEEAIDKWKEVTGLDPAKWSGGGMGVGQSPVLDLARGFAIKKGKEVIDPETGRSAYNTESGDIDEDVVNDFAMDVVMRAIKSYNPFKAEDTQTGSAGHEGERASLGTYLYQAMMNEIKSRKDKFARRADPARGGGIPYSLTQPLGGEESLTLEETIAEKGRAEENIDWEALLEPLRERLYERVQKPGSKFTPDSAERMIDIFKRIFVDRQRMSSVARSLGLTVDRPRAKEIAVMKTLGIDVSSLPKTVPPDRSVTQDREDRQRLWVNFFATLLKDIAELRKQEQTPEVAAKLKSLLEKQSKAKQALDALTQPNVGRIHNLFWGDPRSATAPAIMPILTQVSPEVAKLVEETSRLRKKQSLEDFLMSIPRLRKEGGLNYTLLRNKIEKRLSRENPQLFKVYTYLYESDYSNPDTARIMKLSPSRITGLKQKVVSTLLDLPEITDFLRERDVCDSPLRRFMFSEGDAVKVLSINETGTILSTYSQWFKIKLDNGNEVLTIKEDLRKHSTLVDSTLNVLSHYFNRDILTPQCYLSFVSNPAKLIILELRPSSEVSTSARLHINNNLVEITEFTEKYPDNLVSILKGHIGTNSTLDTPFTSLFEEVESND